MHHARSHCREKLCNCPREAKEKNRGMSECRWRQLKKSDSVGSGGWDGEEEEKKPLLLSGCAALHSSINRVIRLRSERTWDGMERGRMPDCREERPASFSVIIVVGSLLYFTANPTLLLGRGTVHGRTDDAFEIRVTVRRWREARQRGERERGWNASWPSTRRWTGRGQ